MHKQSLLRSVCIFDTLEISTVFLLHCSRVNLLYLLSVKRAHINFTNTLNKGRACRAAIFASDFTRALCTEYEDLDLVNQAFFIPMLRGNFSLHCVQVMRLILSSDQF